MFRAAVFRPGDVEGTIECFAPRRDVRAKQEVPSSRVRATTDTGQREVSGRTAAVSDGLAPPPTFRAAPKCWYACREVVGKRTNGS